MAPGRWNDTDQLAIYTSAEISLTILERLVHTSKNTISTNLSLMVIEVSGEWKVEGPVRTDSGTGGHVWIYPDFEEVERTFHRSPEIFGGGNRPLAIAVPSVIIPACNVVLYPAATAFWQHVKLTSVEPFRFDIRLFPEGSFPEHED